MAERRMFAKTIIDSDAFLDMPLSAQALYFHLSMRADDEGFINSPRKIQRMIGASDDDLKILTLKNFVIPFDSGIVVIKHWRIHNYIRADRLIKTTYEEERGLLKIKDNGAYTITEDLKEIEKLDSEDLRKLAYKNSSLPYSFSYKMRRAFENQNCPICNRIMTSAYKSCMPTIQHNTPISKGGSHELDNISIVCESCNTSIKANQTDALNNSKVIEIWDRIISFEAKNIKWMDEPSILWQTDDGQVSDKCLSNVRIGKDSIDKISIGKVSIDNTPLTPQGDTTKKTKKTLTDQFKELVNQSELSELLKNKINEWIDYKNDIKKPYKTERGFKQFLTIVAKYSLNYSDDEIIEVINKTMASEYQGIVWEWLNKNNNKAGGSYIDAINNRVNVVDDWV